MEYVSPSEQLRVYKYLDYTSSDYNSIAWARPIPDDSASMPAPAHVLCENVIALVLAPKKSSQDPTQPYTMLAKDFEYNSRTNVRGDPQPPNAHQLPPVVEVILVCIDEASALRLQASYGTNRSAYFESGDQSIFFDNTKVFQSADTVEALEDPINALTAALSKKRITYRVFRSDVMLQNSKWSTP